MSVKCAECGSELEWTVWGTKPKTGRLHQAAGHAAEAIEGAVQAGTAPDYLLRYASDIRAALNEPAPAPGSKCVPHDDWWCECGHRYLLSHEDRPDWLREDR